MEERERCYSSVLSRTPHETNILGIANIFLNQKSVNKATLIIRKALIYPGKSFYSYPQILDIFDSYVTVRLSLDYSPKRVARSPGHFFFKYSPEFVAVFTKSNGIYVTKKLILFMMYLQGF
jgi:hypothetical protein